MIDAIRGDNPKAFTRKRKTDPLGLLLQTLAKRGKTQRAEVRDFLGSLGGKEMPDISDVGFFRARMKFSPEAMLRMSKGFLRSEEGKRKLRRLRGFRILAVDGSDLVLPSNTKRERFATPTKGNGEPEDMPVMCKLSALTDCLNGLILDLLVDPAKHSERDHAKRMAEAIPEDMREDAVIVMDRGYYAFWLAVLLSDLHLHFVFRLSSYMLKEHCSGMKPGEEKTVEVRLTKGQLAVMHSRGKETAGLEGRVLKARICCIWIGETAEFLLTDLSAEEMPLADMAELYHLRWNIETAFRTLKENLRMNEYSGRRERLILQDIYCSVWLLNLLSLYVADLGHETAKGRKHRTRINMNNAIGILKTMLVRALFHPCRNERKRAEERIRKEILAYVCPVRPGRSYSRIHACKNRSRMSYRSNF